MSIQEDVEKAAINHARFCDDCDVDFVTFTGHLCPRGRALLGSDLPPKHECTANSADPCDNCRTLDNEANRPSLKDMLRTETHRIVRNYLEQFDGNVARTARWLKMNRRSLYRVMNDMGIKSRYRGRPRKQR